MSRNRIAIVGIGETRPVRRSDKSLRILVVEAAEMALADAGLAPKDVCGVVSDGLVMPSTVPRDCVAADSIARFALDRLAHFKIPGWVAFLEQLPTTYSQKLRKGAIFGDDDPRRHPTAIDVRKVKQSRSRQSSEAAT